MENKENIREIYYYREYYLDFFEEQTPAVQKKLNWTLQLIASLEKVPVKYFKHLQGTKGLYEIRAEAVSEIFRVFCFFDEGSLVIILNGFQKKSQKTPAGEIALAEKLRKYYYYEKENS